MVDIFAAFAGDIAESILGDRPCVSAEGRAERLGRAPNTFEMSYSCYL